MCFNVYCNKSGEVNLCDLKNKYSEHLFQVDEFWKLIKHGLIQVKLPDTH